jgi:hypothetical protein
VLGKGNVSAFTWVVEDDEEGEPAHAEMLGDGEGGGGFHVDGEITGPVPGVDLSVALGEQGGGGPDGTAMVPDGGVDGGAGPIDEVG